MPDVEKQREQQGRDTYCDMFGHDLKVRQVKASGVLFLHCTNECSFDRKYRLILWEE